MGKTRVFELAKKLGLESKELLEKLAQAGVSAASHMSVLEDEDIKKLEQASTSTVEKVEEQRVKPGIIRRRKREVPAPAAEQEKAAEEQKVEPPEVPAAEAPSETDVSQKAKADQPVEPPKEEQAVPKDEEVQAPAEGSVEKKAAAEGEQAAGSSREEAPQEAKAETSDEKPAAQETPQAEETQKSEAKKPAAREKKPEKATASRAKVLGRVDLSTLPGAPSRSSAPSRPAENTRRDRPARRDSTPGTPPAGAGDDRRGGGAAGRSRPSFTPPAAPDEVFQPKEVRGGKKNKKGKGAGGASEDSDQRRGRKGRKLEVFEPERSGKMRRPKKGARQTKQPEVTISKAIKRVIRITDSITVGELAKRMGIKANELIRELMKQGSMVTINHPLDFETAALLASEYNYEVENVAFDEAAILEDSPAVKPGTEEDKPEDLELRPPVVTVMGHVDHGKTSLLDAIRAAKVTEGEAGGITQHIGAYHVELNGRKISFLDTPGHEAFTAMRARGAKATDIVILVVAADDGVMPQTKEAINHAKAAGVPIVVAINKIDKPDANPDRVKQELTEFELIPEEWGGETIFAEVSAKEQLNIESLLEMVLLQAEVMELKANPNKRGRGIIVEARLDKGRGPVATVLVQEGTLHIGDPIVSGVHHGRVRSMVDDRGGRVENAGPSMPVEVTGLSGVPDAGDLLYAVEDEKKAKDVALHRQQKLREAELAKTSKISLDQLYA
ncbi:MAG TPA: translation initiation factor IF-2, partial [Geoalkalibacter subterraneus]|nr:translation initiation factor IF-2 [Geoalkalibacter subterraneus]